MRKPFTGLRAWLVQRITAVYMLLFLIVFLAHFAVDPPHSYPAWRGWMMSSGMSIATAVFFAALLAHAWVGMRDVILDYVHSTALRVGVFVCLSVGLAAMGIWVIRVLWMEHGIAV